MTDAVVWYAQPLRIIALMDGVSCPAIDFLTAGEQSTKASREGLAVMLDFVSKHGLQAMPAPWGHEADKQNGIFEFIKGRLRLLYFKGLNGDLVVCTVGYVKKSGKADKKVVAAAIRMKTRYVSAQGNIEYQEISDGT